MTTEPTSSQQSGVALDLPRIDRTVTQVTRAEDGWALEVEDATGVRLTYWIADPGWVPPAGTIARFYHRNCDRSLCALEIDGQFVFDACQDHLVASGTQ